MTKRAVRNLALYVDVRRAAAVEAARSVAELAERSGVKLQVGKTQAHELGLNGTLGSASFPASADLMVSLGGDGTLLQAAHLAGPLGIPIVGVDFGRVGFLTELPRDGYQAALASLFASGVTSELHLALEARIVGRGAGFYAVNDVHIDRRHHGNIVNFGIELSGAPIATIPADGIVVASPTGSTAYFLSAGGPIMSPKLEAFGIAPICPHTLFSRPLVVSADETVAVTIPKDCSGTQFFVDGRPQAELEPGARIEIVRSAHPVQFVRLGDQFFFQTLERKLHWGVSIKQAIEESP